MPNIHPGTVKQSMPTAEHLQQHKPPCHRPKFSGTFPIREYAPHVLDTVIAKNVAHNIEVNAVAGRSQSQSSSCNCSGNAGLTLRPNVVLGESTSAPTIMTSLEVFIYQSDAVVTCDNVDIRTEYLQEQIRFSKVFLT